MHPIRGFCWLAGCLFFLLPLSAQLIVDDFSDGDLLNPDYQGDLADFVVENDSLRLMADGAGTSQLFLPLLTDTAQSIAYELNVFLDFSPSASNFAAFYFDGFTPAGDAVRYELRVGGISGSDDALIFSRDGVELIVGTIGAVGGEPVQVRWRLERSATNEWRLLADYQGSNALEEQGTSQDPDGEQPALLNTFTLECNYTSTRSDKFWFDELELGPVIVDNDPPQLLSAAVGASDNQIVLTFNESVTGESITELDNYTFNPESLELQSLAVNASEIILTLTDEIPTGQEITVTVIDVADNFGNVSEDLSASFLLPLTVTPNMENLIITEFMADPTPEVGLPDAEYVEIYNRGEATIRLRDLGIASGGAPSLLPDVNLEPGSYATIVRASLAEEFEESANVIAVGTLPALSNSGDVIELIFDGEIIQQLEYDLSWYKDDERSDGGYSLELADLDANDLNCAGLWAASIDNDGGTPGALNSRNGEILDDEGPQLLSATFATGGIRLFFSENIDLASAAGSISVEPDLQSNGVLPDANGSFRLVTQSEPQEGIIYTVTVAEDIQDCAGNFSDTIYEVELGLAEEVAIGDVVINEVLFNPATGGSDFVELFNCSDKILNVNGWTLANTITMTGSPREQIEADRLLLPGGYLAFTEDRLEILAGYEQAQEAFLIENDLPSLANDLGNVTLVAPNGDTLDSYDYTEEQHSALLDDVNGVSLERVNAKAATQQDGNWFSAASRVGFATPTRVNSQARAGIVLPEEDGFFFLDEDTFSPDGDGFQDALFINYSTPGPGWNARITIYDANGRPVRSLRRAEPLAGEGTILWDGATDEQQLARTGIYILLIERFEPNGETENEKLVAVLVNPK
ncbi:hypothetical protein CEQ90_10360 [Lewinellaceae bacterium SD302]|nr:hypothetical protein CEQ90_10360 [Lewinellaceae bacterium SD302]